MLLRDLGDAQELFRTTGGSFVGAGITAFSRISPSFFVESYQIFCVRRTLDLPLIRRTTPVVCLEEEFQRPLHGQVVDSFQLMDRALMRDGMAKLPPPRYLLPYQNYPDLERLAKREKWHLLANPFQIRNEMGGRHSFKKLVRELGLPAVKGDIYPVRTLQRTDYLTWVKMFGAPIVVQLPEICQGGGRGTFFVDSAKDYRQLQARLQEGTWRGIPLTSVSVNEYVKGMPVSMALCITRHGLLMSRLQRQLIDLPYCNGMPERGIFCGHTWDDTPWPGAIVQEAQRQATLMGGYLGRVGYRGIFGVDFVLDEGRGHLVPIELNPRYTGAFPVLSLLHMEKNLIPMEAFHMLEFMGVPYQIHVEELNDWYAEPLHGSHLILFLQPSSGTPPWLNLRGGVYQYDSRSRSVFHVKDTIQVNEMNGKNQFIVADGPPAWPLKDQIATDPFTRLCRLLFPYPVTDRTRMISSGAVSCILGREL